VSSAPSNWAIERVFAGPLGSRSYSGEIKKNHGPPLALNLTTFG